VTGETIHATCIAFGDVGVLLRGPPGAGKSDLALRLIDSGAVLVADDRVALCEKAGKVVARSPEPLSGRLEVRGLGILSFPPVDDVPIRLICDLGNPAAIERLPVPGVCAYLGVRIHRMDVAPFEASASAKVRLAAYAAACKADPATGATTIVSETGEFEG
jgi:HPr kinase/phosphorylase